MDKRLYKSNENRMIDGVCGGIAEYFNMDPTLVRLGCGAVCFEGNIDFYGKSGFTYADKFSIRYHGLPEGEDASFFLCKELIPGYLDGFTGEYATPQGYYVDKAEVETFDKEFPVKEKLNLPGQLFQE